MNKYLTLIIISLLSIIISLSVGCVQNDNEASRALKDKDYYLNNYEDERIKIEYLCHGCELIDEQLLTSIIENQNNTLTELIRNPLTYEPKSLNGKCEQIKNAVHMDTEEVLSNLYRLSLSIKYQAMTDMGVKKEDSFENVYNIHNGQINDTIFGKIKLDSIKFLSEEKEYVSRKYEVVDFSRENSVTITPVIKSNSLLVKFGDQCVKPNSKLIFNFRDETDIVVTTNDYSCAAITRIELTSSLKRELGRKQLAGIAVIPEYGNDYIFTDTPDNQKDYFIQLINLIE
jgi:hypothetical protein